MRLCETEGCGKKHFCRGLCSTCHTRREYHANPDNRAKRAARGSRWRSDNKDTLNDKRRERYQTDPAYRESVLARQNEKYASDEAHRERIAAKSTARQKENREEYLTYQRAYAKANAPKNRARASQWAKDNRLRARINKANYWARRKNAPGYFTDEEWQDVSSQYGDTCPRCLLTCDDFTIDHIQPLSREGTNWIWNLQPLCASCNSSKNDGPAVYYPPPCHSR